MTLTPKIMNTIMVLKVVSRLFADENEIADAKNKKNKNGPHISQSLISVSKSLSLEVFWQKNLILFKMLNKSLMSVSLMSSLREFYLFGLALFCWCTSISSNTFILIINNYLQINLLTVSVLTLIISPDRQEDVSYQYSSHQVCIYFGEFPVHVLH